MCLSIVFGNDVSSYSIVNVTRIILQQSCQYCIYWVRFGFYKFHNTYTHKHTHTHLGDRWWWLLLAKCILSVLHSWHLSLGLVSKEHQRECSSMVTDSLKSVMESIGARTGSDRSSHTSDCESSALVLWSVRWITMLHDQLLSIIINYEAFSFTISWEQTRTNQAMQN